VTLALAACGRKGSTSEAARTRAFVSASPEIKVNWEGAVSALKTNDYVGSQLALFNLRAQTNLTTEQMTLVEDTLKAASGRMFDAAARGDTNALEAMRELHELRAIGRMR
jgi:hypothetical protein